MRSLARLGELWRILGGDRGLFAGAIVRRYKGKTLRVTVLADGFEFMGERFGSLSAIAKAVTGTHVNGFRFFGLAKEAA